MSPELIQAIQNIGIEAIKILGPAIIAAVVAYKVAKTQTEAKLKEVDKRNEFDARKAVYDLLIQRKEKLSENIKGITENLAFLMGAASGADEDSDFDTTLIEFSNTNLRTAQRMSQLTKEHFEKKQLRDKVEFGVVESCIEKVSAIQPATDFETLRENSLALLPIYEDLAYAHDSLIDWEMDEILAPFIDQGQPNQSTS